MPQENKVEACTFGLYGGLQYGYYMGIVMFTEATAGLECRPLKLTLYYHAVGEEAHSNSIQSGE